MKTRALWAQGMNKIGALLFLVGLTMAAVLSVMIFWPDQEARPFAMSLGVKERLPGLACPLIITPRDNAEVTVKVRNTHDRPTSLRFLSSISEGTAGLLREDTQQIDLDPGETNTLAWPIAIEDAAYDRIVMARVQRYSRPPFAAGDQSCGVLVINAAQVTGKQIVTGIAVVATLLTGVGIALWLRHAWPLDSRDKGTARVGAAMLLLVLLSILLGVMQQPYFALIVLLGAGVFVFSLIERTLMRT